MENTKFFASDDAVVTLKTEADKEKVLEFIAKDEWYTQLFERLDNSKFRSGFHLKKKDREYVREKGLETIQSCQMV